MTQTDASSRADTPEPVTPRDAASLVVVDRSGSEPRFLMGRRSRGHGFMPGVYVFPGGAVEPGDIALAQDIDLSSAVAERLGAHSELETSHLAALPIAAIRETLEETGFVVGERAPGVGSLSSRNSFSEIGVHPQAKRLVPVARAITPSEYPTRYDARFFAVDRKAGFDRANTFECLSDELEDIGWFSGIELAALSLADITRHILRDVTDRLYAGNLFDSNEPMPFYRREDGVFKRDLI